MYLPEIFRTFPDLVAAQSNRSDGVLKVPSVPISPELAWNDPASVDKNRCRFAKILGLSANQFAGAHQVHGSEVALVAEAGELAGYDALICNKPGIILTITTADCLPVLIYDPANRACGAAHAGWRGSAAAIARKTVTAMRDAFGTTARDCLAYIGPGISFANFEVGPEVARQFPARFVRTGDKAGKYLVDLKGVNLQQLEQAGLLATQIELSNDCTFANNDRYFSYRKEAGRTGRMLTVIGVTK